MSQTATLPLVSIIIINYNFEAYIAQAIDCALAQTYPRVEVIVVDDGSTDSSREVIARYNSRVKVILKENGGQCSAYNAGYAQAVGSILYFLDGDDLLDADGIAQVVPLFERGVARVHFRLRIIDAQGRKLGGVIPRLLSDNRAAQALVERGYLYASSPASGNVYAREVLEHLMPIPLIPGDRGGGEFSLVYGAGLYGEIRAHNEVIGSYRVHTPVTDGSVRELVFGNAARFGDETTRRLERAARFSATMLERSGGRIRLPARLIEFSQEKELFGVKVMSATTYAGRISAGLRGAGDYFLALRLIPNASLGFKVAAGIWAICIVVLPRPAGFYLCRYAANPAAR